MINIGHLTPAELRATLQETAAANPEHPELDRLRSALGWRIRTIKDDLDNIENMASRAAASDNEHALEYWTKRDTQTRQDLADALGI